MPNQGLTDEISTRNLIHAPETVVPCSTTAIEPKANTLSLSTKILHALTLSFSEACPSDPPKIHKPSNIPGTAGLAQESLYESFQSG